jgi:uncharacterized membrane protein YesL
MVGLFRLFWIMALLVWFSVQLYMWTLFYEMENPSLWQALRNAAVMVYLNPWFTLSLWALIIPIAMISVVIPALWLLLTGSLFAIVGTDAALDRLYKAGYRNPQHGVRAEYTKDLP